MGFFSRSPDLPLRHLTLRELYIKACKEPNFDITPYLQWYAKRGDDILNPKGTCNALLKNESDAKNNDNDPSLAKTVTKFAVAAALSNNSRRKVGLKKTKNIKKTKKRKVHVGKRGGLYVIKYKKNPLTGQNTAYKSYLKQ